MKINHVDQELVTVSSANEVKKSSTPDGEKHNDRYFEIPKLLDGFRVLNSAQSEDPEFVYSADISGQDLKFVLEDDLMLFTRLETLKAGENRLPFCKLGAIPSLRKLILPCNEIVCIDLEVEGRFDYLEHLDLSYNFLDISALAVLASLPSLKYLDLTRNGISRFPSVIRTMQKWKDYVIERLLPKQVAALEATIGLSQDVHASKRSFKSTVSISRSKSRISLTEDQREEMRRSESRISSVSKRLAGSFTPASGFPELQTLVLEGNNISSSDVFDILGVLPNLVNLNMNHNMLMALNALIPNNYNGPADVLNDNPKKITKYSGFLKLEELSLKFNRIPQLDNLIGLLCLPKIKNVYLEGNSVLKYCCTSKLKAKEDDPFYIFPSLYKINIVDLPNGGPTAVNLDTHYAVSPTKYGMAVVRKPRRKEVPHFIGQILRRAAVRGPHLVATHKVDQKRDKLVDIVVRNIRRTYSFTEDDIDNIIRMGQIPKIRDLKVFGETRMQMEKEMEDPVQIGAKDMLYDPEKQDSTFITGVHITENDEVAGEAEKIESEADAESSEGDDNSEGERDFLSHYPLPLNVQTAVKSLRHALSNPTSYWRILEDSYIRPTAASLKRSVDVRVKDDSLPHENLKQSEEQLNYSLDEIDLIGKQLEDKQLSRNSLRPTPANTVITPHSRNDATEHGKPYGEMTDPSAFQHAVAAAIGDGKAEDRPIGKRAGKLAFKRVKNRKLSKSHPKAYDELSQLNSMMDNVEKKISRIELDLSTVLKYSEIQKKLPQSKKLLKEIKEEYNKLQDDLLEKAKAKFKEDAKTGFANVEDGTASELNLHAH